MSDKFNLLHIYAILIFFYHLNLYGRQMSIKAYLRILIKTITLNRVKYSKLFSRDYQLDLTDLLESIDIEKL